MRFEQVERRTAEDERVRFEEVKEFVTFELGRVQQRMPQPWFDELVSSLARLRMRVQRPT